MALSNYKISTLVLFIMYDVCFVKHTNISYELITCSGINRLFSQPPQKKLLSIRKLPVSIVPKKNSDRQRFCCFQRHDTKYASLNGLISKLNVFRIS